MGPSQPLIRTGHLTRTLAQPLWARSRSLRCGIVWIPANISRVHLLPCFAESSETAPSTPRTFTGCVFITSCPDRPSERWSANPALILVAYRLYIPSTPSTGQTLKRSNFDLEFLPIYYITLRINYNRITEILLPLVRQGTYFLDFKIFNLRKNGFILTSC